MSTWEEVIVADLESLGDELNTVLTDAGLDPLVDWLKGEPRPMRVTDTPFGWFHYRPTEGVQGKHEKSGVTGVAPMLIGLVLAAGSGEDLIDLTAGVKPRLQAHLETRAWPCNREIGGWELAVQDENQHLDIYALPIDLMWFRAYGSDGSEQ